MTTTVLKKKILCSVERVIDLRLSWWPTETALCPWLTLRWLKHKQSNSPSSPRLRELFLGHIQACPQHICRFMACLAGQRPVLALPFSNSNMFGCNTSMLLAIQHKLEMQGLIHGIKPFPTDPRSFTSPSEAETNKM